MSTRWKLQLGYVGSRSHKLLIMWYLNRAHPMDGVAQTTATLNASVDPNGFSTTGWFRYSTVNPGACDQVFGTATPFVFAVPKSDTGRAPRLSKT